MLLGFIESSSEIFISSYSRIFSNGDRANFFSFRIIKRYVIHAGSKSFLFSSLIALIDVIDIEEISVEKRLLDRCKVQ